MLMGVDTCLGVGCSSSSHSSVSVDDEPNVQYLFRARCRVDSTSSTPPLSDQAERLHFKVYTRHYVHVHVTP